MWVAVGGPPLVHRRPGGPMAPSTGQGRQSALPTGTVPTAKKCELTARSSGRRAPLLIPTVQAHHPVRPTPPSPRGRSTPAPSSPVPRRAYGPAYGCPPVRTVRGRQRGTSHPSLALPSNPLLRLRHEGQERGGHARSLRGRAVPDEGPEAAAICRDIGRPGPPHSRNRRTIMALPTSTSTS